MRRIKSLRTKNNIFLGYAYYIFVFHFLMIACKNKGGTNDSFKVMDGGTWNIIAIKSHSGYLVGNAEHNIVYGSYLYTDFKYKKILIEIQDKKIEGDFLIKKNGDNYKFKIFNTSDSLFNRDYDINLKMLSKNAFSTNYSLSLLSDSLLILAKKVQMGNDSD